MTDNELKKNISKAFAAATPDVFDRIMCSIEGSAALKPGVITFTPKSDVEKRVASPVKKKNPWIVRAILIAVAAAAILATTVGISAYTAATAVASTVSIDVNPSIEIKVNKNRRVLSVVPKSEDAVEIIGDMNFKGTDLEVTVNALLGAMISKGYLSEIANSILISVDNADPETAAALQELLMNEVNELLLGDTFNGAIIGQTLTNDEELKARAEEYGITISKAQLIDRIVSQNPALKFEDLVHLTINELNLLLKTYDSAAVSSIGEASDGAFIGSEKATETALGNVGFTRDEVSGLHVEMDYDDGALVYEVSFNVGGEEYDYDIDAVSGAVLDFDKEYDD